MVGTERGDLIIFKIDNSHSSCPIHRQVNGVTSNSKRGFSYVASYHCGHSPILSIYTTTPHPVSNLVHSFSPALTSLLLCHIIVNPGTNCICKHLDESLTALATYVIQIFLQIDQKVLHCLGSKTPACQCVKTTEHLEVVPRMGHVLKDRGCLHDTKN